MNNLYSVDSVKKNKYDKIIEYLQQNDEYWINNDIWDITENFFVGRKLKGYRYVDFSNIKYNVLKNELKYYLLFNFKNEFLKPRSIVRFNKALRYFDNFVRFDSFLEIQKDKLFIEWKMYLLNNGIEFTHNNVEEYFSFTNCITDFIKNFYDEREETEKDIWYSKNIRGARVSAASSRIATSINFNEIPLYYRETVKAYLRTIITKKSWSHCSQIINKLNYFFNYFSSNGYGDGFIENLNRNDIEKYLYNLGNGRKDKNKTETSKFVSYIRTFLEYIQMAQYDKASRKEVSFLIFQDDIPKRELNMDVIKRVKFVPEPILKQIDSNIKDLDRPQYIPIYILLRETGWRGTDILNLRYHNCLEQIWNNKEQKYNYYLCGEITKTGIVELRIPVRDKVAEMVQRSIDKAKELSTDENNPKRYLFNTYKGKLKGYPLNKTALVDSIKRLIREKDIKDANGELYHFRLHSLRHTKAKELVEDGMGLSIIQQILGHRSLQMSAHYASVSENMLYEKWKDTEENLELFKLNTETDKLEPVDLNSDNGENLIRYEFVRKNLDAVKVPFGICFKPSKLSCKQQINHCLTCASFCTTIDNTQEYEQEIECVKKQIEISEKCGRELWVEKNKEYLNLLEETLKKIKEQKVVHKNGSSREETL